VSQFTANALEEAPTGSGASVTAIADEVQTRTIAGVTVVNGLAANVITAAATAADFSTEVQSGLATASALTTLSNTIGAAGAGLTAVPWNAAWAAQVRASIGQATANLDTQLSAIPVNVWSEIIEDQGSVSARCAMAAILAFAAGDWTSSGSTATFEDASGSETRIEQTTATGSRSVTITCPTY
jgi:hypothetical protein